MKSKAMIMIVCSCYILSGCVKTNISQSEGIETAQTKETAADTKQEVESQTSVTAVLETETENYVIAESQTSEQDLLEAVHEKYYSQWTESGMQNTIAERKQYREKCTFYPEVEEYLEKVREVTDISSLVEPLYYTDMKIYQKQDFDNVPPLIIHLAKNEIYARHGYIFKNEDLNNYFKGQIWYEPSITPENFKDSLFNKNEQANLKLLSGLDSYK